MRFVPAKEGNGLLGSTQVKSEGDVKGKGKAIDQDEEGIKIEPKERARVTGDSVKGLYANIVGLRSSTSSGSTSNASPARPPPPRQLKRPRSRTSPLSTPKREPDIILSSSSSSESESDSPPSPSTPNSDDDIIIVDPLTSLPITTSPIIPPPPRRRDRLKPLLIHEMLSLPSTSSQPLVPPTYYALPDSNVGYRLLHKQGWREGETLGPLNKEQGRGLKVPLKAKEKFDRAGLGVVGKRKMTGEEKEEERMKRVREERERRGKGTRGMERKRLEERRERKEWISYMNR